MPLERLTPDLRRCIFRYCYTGLARAQVWVAGENEDDDVLMDVEHRCVHDAAIVSYAAADWLLDAVDGSNAASALEFRCRAHPHAEQTLYWDMEGGHSGASEKVRAFRSLYNEQHGCGCIHAIMRMHAIKKFSIQTTTDDCNSIFALIRMTPTRADRWRQWLQRI